MINIYDYIKQNITFELIYTDKTGKQYTFNAEVDEVLPDKIKVIIPISNEYSFDIDELDPTELCKNFGFNVPPFINLENNFKSNPQILKEGEILFTYDTIYEYIECSLFEKNDDIRLSLSAFKSCASKGVFDFYLEGSSSDVLNSYIRNAINYCDLKNKKVTMHYGVSRAEFEAL